MPTYQRGLRSRRFGGANRVVVAFRDWWRLISVQLFVYAHRSSLWMWVMLVGMSLGIMFGLFTWLRQLHEPWLNSPGPWTLVLALGGAPVAWVIWLIRDHNKTLDLRQAEQNHVQQVFEKLQEWATGENPTLQAAALHQLRPFMLGLAEGPLPERLSGVNSPFIVPSLAILRALLDDRRWLETSEREHQGESTEGRSTRDAAKGGPEGAAESKPTPRSPVLLATERILKDPAFARLLNPRFTNSTPFGPKGPLNVWNWNLSGLYLAEAGWDGCDLTGVVLNGAGLQEAHLEQVILHSAQLERAQLPYANLEGANLIHANLERANLGGANLKEARLLAASLKGAELTGATLERADLRNAHLEGAAVRRANLEGTDLEGAWRGGNDPPIPGWVVDAKGRLHRAKPQTHSHSAAH